MIKYLLIILFSTGLTSLSGQSPSKPKNAPKQTTQKASRKVANQVKAKKVSHKDKPKKTPKEGKQIAIDEEGVSEEHLNKKKKAAAKKKN